MANYPRVLVTDDSQYMRMLLTAMLKRIGFVDIVQADDGSAAIDLLKNEKFDLVLLDYMMPQTNGLEVLRFIRSQENLADTKVILVTANADQELVGEALGPQARVDAIVVKPLSLSTLKSKIEMVLAKRTPVV